ncbi:transcription termination factor Rho [Actinokineospora enzanensis]|uniref:transcription termination factor Rho n=1 Tax=Actinokineospora enzanensis TaxID=155975 RepID=UPI0003644E13
MSDHTFTGVLDLPRDRPTVRVEGYLPSEHDVPLPPRVLREHGLRRGDTISGEIRAGAVHLDSVNGAHPRHARQRAVFTELVPVHPHHRLRLETEPHALTARTIDLVMPIGKGQRALIVAPPKAGKTTVLRAIAEGVAKNHPECHLMAVLVGERPEEVTDLGRSLPGEVIAATFDHAPAAQTALAELAVERAKRLTESGRDVVVLLDSITRLGRAYNLAAPASGRILSGGVDSAALTPPKRLLGAARAIDGGGSLTIIATALVDTGSQGDTLIFEEFKGTGNAELRLDRSLADARVFPAIDVTRSSTRKEELLLSPGELSPVQLLRRVLQNRERSTEVLLDGLRKTQTNVDFLRQLLRATPH